MPIALPTKDEIIAYLAEADDAKARRDLARHFGVRGAMRAELRHLLKEMEADGLIDLKSGKRIAVAGRLPPVTPIDVISVDDDGDLICEPGNWREETAPPLIRINARQADKQKPPPGIGDRLLARLTPRWRRQL